MRGCRLPLIALDTNVLVRFLVADEPSESRLSVELFAAAKGAGIDLFVASVVRESSLAAGCTSVATFELDLWKRRGAPFVAPGEAIRSLRRRR